MFDLLNEVIMAIKHFMRNKKLLLTFLIRREFCGDEFCEFTCNICGKLASSPASVVINREVPSCAHCGSSKRFRSILAALSEELFGEIIPLPDFDKRDSMVGIGLSDSCIYAKPLSEKFSYENTFYHQEPRLDIMSISKKMHNSADFVIASDVFEHVPPPIETAFENLFKILKKGGVCIFSVPYTNWGETQEHFPELFDYKIVTEDNKRVLINKTQGGRTQVFQDIHFHGGGGATLEMRVFSKSSLLNTIQKAGFTQIKLHQSSISEYGIPFNKGAVSLTISMRKE